MLRQARREKAQELNMPPYIVFADAALRDMARRKPPDKEAFLRVSGVGQAKCDNFGDHFLEIIRAFLEKNPDATPAANAAQEPTVPEETAAPVREKMPKSEACRRAAELFAQGMSLMEVSEALERRPGTVGTYLQEYIRSRGATDPGPWVEPAVVEKVKEAVAAVGADRLNPIFEYLDGQVPYEAIRVCLACFRNAGIDAGSPGGEAS